VAVSEFNDAVKCLPIDLKFENPPSFSSFQRCLTELVALLKRDQIIACEIIMNSLLAIVAAVPLDSSFFALSHLCIRRLYRAFPSVGVVAKSLAVYEVLSSGLPIVYVRSQLLSITADSAVVLIRLLSDPSSDPMARCLAVAACVPSFCLLDQISIPDATPPLLLPDPLVLLSHHRRFASGDFVHAIRLLQSAHSLVRSFASVPTFSQLCRVQDIITASHISRASLCLSVCCFASSAETMPCAVRFLRALDTSCGAELLRELILANTSVSYGRLMRNFGSLISSILDEYRLAPAFVPVYSVFGVFFEPALDTVKAQLEAPRASYLAWAHSMLLRLSFEPVFRFADFIITHFNLIKAHVVRIIRETVIDANLSSPISNQLSLNVLCLFYETVERLALRALSPQFLRDTVTVLNFLMFVPVLDRSAIILDVRRLYDVLARIVVAHSRLFANFVNKFASYGEPLGCAIIGSLVKIDVLIIGRLLKITLDSSLSAVFQIALNMCRPAAEVPGFASMFSDLFLDFLVRDAEPKFRNRYLASYFSIGAELVGWSSLFANEFVQTVAFPRIVDLVDELCDEFRGNLPHSDLVFLDAILFFSARLYQKADRVLPRLHLNTLFGLIHQLPEDSAKSLVNLALAVGRQHGAFPYVVDWTKFEGDDEELVTRLRRGIDNPTADHPPGQEDRDEETPLLPWAREVVRGFGSVTLLPVITRRPEHIPRSQTIVVLPEAM
jgi:hypothetical protein